MWKSFDRFYGTLNQIRLNMKRNRDILYGIFDGFCWNCERARDHSAELIHFLSTVKWGVIESFSNVIKATSQAPFYSLFSAHFRPSFVYMCGVCYSHSAIYMQMISIQLHFIARFPPIHADFFWQFITGKRQCSQVCLYSKFA